MRIPAAAVIHLSSILAPFSGVMVEEASVDDDFRRIEEATSGEEAEVVAMVSDVSAMPTLSPCQEGANPLICILSYS